MKACLTSIFLIFNFILLSQSLESSILVLPDKPSEKDFAFLKSEMGNAQIVMLGESTHFDGNVFEMKSKIIKYLFEELGFKTIAFESGIYDVWKAQMNIKNGGSVPESLKKSLYPIWSKKEEFKSFITFLEQNKNEVKIFGFDNQISGEYGVNELANDLSIFCKKNKYKFKLDKNNLELLLESMVISGVFDEGDITYKEYNSSLLSVYNQIETNSDDIEKFYWKQIIQSLIFLGNDLYNYKEEYSSFYTTSADNNRDKIMAENLIAYLKKNPKEKIICWGANQHFVKDMSSVKEPVLKDFIPMGSYIKKEFGDNFYSLAMITASDSIFIQNRWNKTAIKSNSFEYDLKSIDKAHLFVSSKQNYMQKVQMNRFFSPITFVEAKLDLLFDGYLFFKNVSPSTPIADDYSAGNKNFNSTEQIKKIHNEVLDIEMQKIDVELKEVIIYSKAQAYQVVRKAINNISINYPTDNFNSEMYTNITTTINDSISLDFEFVADQYDYPYDNNIRSSKSLKEINWKKNIYEPKNLREFHSLIYNNPIKYAPFLDLRKSKKYSWNIEDIVMIDNKSVYVISFSASRNHSSYTKRMFTSNYNGLLLINKDDYAIVKVVENWDVIQFPEEFKQGFHLKEHLKIYTQKEFFNENIETNFKKINNKYFIVDSKIKIEGQIITNQKDSAKSLPFQTLLFSSWKNIGVESFPISNKMEIHDFDKIIYNKLFWDSYTKPKQK